MKWLFLIGFWVWITKGNEIKQWIENSKRQEQQKRLAYREYLKEALEDKIQGIWTGDFYHSDLDS